MYDEYDEATIIEGICEESKDNVESAEAAESEESEAADAITLSC